MRKISQYRRNCVLVALQNVSGKSDEEVIRACEVTGGWKPNDGMRDMYWQRAAKSLGIDFTEEKVQGAGVRIYDENRKWTSMYGWEREGRFVNKSLTLGKFCKDFTEGTYLVTVPGHLLVVRDGIIDDPNYWRRANRRRIERVKRVNNPSPLPERNHVQVLNFYRKAKNPMSMAAVRYKQMAHFVRWAGKPVTPQMIFENTKYRPADLAYDVKTGNVRMVP